LRATAKEEERPAWGKKVDDVARPMSPKGLAAESLIDAQIACELAIRAVRLRRTEEAIRCMQIALASAKIAAGKVEGLDMKPKPPGPRLTRKQVAH